jgi:ligand-binding SRPBCC domain-containing protein
MAKRYHLRRSQTIARPLREVFAFFADPSNLEAITPPFLRFRIMTPAPLEMRVGARIDYRLSLWRVPVGWRTRITCFEPDARFIDQQESGPYADWHHLHEFESDGASTRMRDEVTYRLPFGPLGALVHAVWVERQLRTIFDYREVAIARRFGESGQRAPGLALSTEALSTEPLSKEALAAEALRTA